MTLGWILEGDIERFYEATEPRYVQSLLTQLHCPFCSEVFESSRALQDHLHAAHATRRPALLIGGREPARIEVLRCAASDAEVHLLDCEEIQLSVDGGAPQIVTEHELLRLLKLDGARRLGLSLTNSGAGNGNPARKKYDLSVALPSPRDLEAADREFVATFATSSPHIAALEDFARDLRGGPAAEYVEGLVEYVRGLLIKDRDPRTGVRQSRAEWPEAYKRSLHILGGYARPLPNLLCSLIRFALNDFGDPDPRSGFPALDRNAKVFAALSQSRSPAPPMGSLRIRDAHDVCPVDAGVSRIIELTHRCGALKRWSAQDNSELEMLTSSEVLSTFDRVKAKAVWAWTAMRLGASGSAVEPLRGLLGSDIFGAWAESILDGVEVAS